MTDRPMHTVPGLYERLTALYIERERAIEENRLHDAVALFSEGIQLDDQFRQPSAVSNGGTFDTPEELYDLTYALSAADAHNCVAGSAKKFGATAPADYKVSLDLFGSGRLWRLR